MLIARPTIRLAALVLAALAVCPSPARSDDEDLAKELPRIKPLTPADALKSFHVQAGFRLRAVATEPLVADPVSVCHDADGRLYVVEMRGYPYPEKVPTGKVRRLEDTNGDGVYDRSTVFVDDVSWPTGVVPYDGGVFIAVVPEILYAKDTNGDGVADVRKVMFSGFGLDNVQGLVNGLLWGPDGWIYGVSGGDGGEIRNHTRPEAKPVSVRGRDFRFRPDGSAFEATSGGGQFGHSFDDWGHRFTCNNSNHARQIILPAWALEHNPALLAGAVLDDVPVEGPAAPVYRISQPEPWRVVRTRQRAADPVMSKRLPPTELVVTGFFTSATGITIYRGDAYPASYHGNLFVGDVGGNLIHRKTLSKAGARFAATRADAKVEFLASTDNWFRPVNFANTPDGTLLVIDMYRETIEHPHSIPEPIKKHLDLTSGHDLGRLYELLPPGDVPHRKPHLSTATTAELVGHLADSAGWWRETAQRLLVERRDPAAPPLLRDLAQRRPSALGRVHALWTLDALGSPDTEAIRTALADEDPNVREQAARLVVTAGKARESLKAPLLPLAADPDPMVRFQVALTLGAFPGADREVVEALATIGLRDAADHWTRLAVETALAGRVPAFVDRLATRDPAFLEGEAGRSWLGDLATLVGTENHSEDVQALTQRFSGAKVDPALTRAVVLGLGRGLQRSGGSLRALLTGPARGVLKPVFERAAELAAGDGPAAARADAARLLSLGPVDRALEVLPDLLDAKQPGAVQMAAIQSLAELTDRQVGPRLVERWRNLSPTLRNEALEALFARPDRLEALLSAVESKTLASTEIDPVRVKRLLAHPNAAVRKRAEGLFQAPTTTDRGRLIESLQPALALTANRDHGREVFRKVCATCHRAEGEGNDVGPNLTTVTSRTPQDLLVHILDPNREVAPNYVNYSVETTDGRIVTGLIASESAAALTLKRAEGATDVVPRNRIEEIASSGLSLMPEGLEQGLSPQDMADLIGYVRGILEGGQTAVK